MSAGEVGDSGAFNGRKLCTHAHSAMMDQKVTLVAVVVVVVEKMVPFSSISL